MDEKNPPGYIECIKDHVIGFFNIMYYMIQSWIHFFHAPHKDLNGEIVLLTGGAGDLGKLMSEKLVQKGCTLILWDINETELKKYSQYLNETYGIDNKIVAYYYKCDISDEKEVMKVSEDLIEKIGHPTIIINNAAIVLGKLFHDLKFEEIKKVYAVNVLSQYLIAKIFLPKMLEQNHGHIVSISSALAADPVAGITEYGPSKAAVWSFMKSLRQEIRVLGKDNVHCTTVLPFHVKSRTGEEKVNTKYKVFSSLCPNYVVDKIISAIQKNQIMLCIPRSMYFACVFYTLWPERVKDVGLDVYGVNEAVLIASNERKPE